MRPYCIYLGFQMCKYGSLSQHFLKRICPLIEKTNNTRTVQSESFEFTSVLFDQGFQIWVDGNWLKCHLRVFCINSIVPYFVVYYVIPLKILFEPSYTVCTHCDINSCERKKVVIHDVAHCDLILCYVYAMKVISVKWHQVSHTTDSVLLSWLHCSSPNSASRVPIRPG